MYTQLRVATAFLVAGLILTACGGGRPASLSQTATTVSVSTSTQSEPMATKPVTPTNTNPAQPSSTPIPALTDTPSPTATPLPILSPTPEEDSIKLSPISGARLVFIPEGQFTMGSGEGDPLANADEKPQHIVYIDSFWMDQTEVTNKMFAAFLNEESNQEEAGTLWFDANSDYAQIDEAGYDYAPKPGYDNYPVVGISWYGAQAYCDWAGGRLPTEAEWEKAARGIEMGIYPWGNAKPGGDLLNSADVSLASEQSSFEINDGFANSAPVGSFPAGISPFGALDMAGNVWEWVSDWYGKDAYNLLPDKNPIGVKDGVLKVVRGGSWFDHPDNARSAYRGGFKPATYWPYVGFRCVFDELIEQRTTPSPSPVTPPTFASEVIPDKHPFYEVVDVREAFDHGYVLVGRISSSTTREYAGKPTDLYVSRLAPDGAVIWQRAYGDTDVDLLDNGTAILPTQDGNILLAGITKGKLINGKPAGIPWLLKLDPDGNVLWEEQLTGIKLTDWMDLTETLEGQYVVAGHELSSKSSSLWLWRLNESGELSDTSKLVLKQGGQVVNWYPYFDLERTYDQGFILGGAYRNRTSGAAQMALIRFNQDGDILWQQAYELSPDVKKPISIVHLRSGGFGVGFTNKGGGHNGPMLGKLDENGQPVWWVSFPYTLINIYRVSTASQGFSAAGWGVDGAWMGLVDANGLIINQVNYVSDPSNEMVIDIFTGLDQTYDGGFILAGTGTKGGSGLNVLRLDASLSLSSCESLTSGNAGSMLIRDKLLSEDELGIEYTLEHVQLQNISSTFWLPGDHFRTPACR